MRVHPFSQRRHGTLKDFLAVPSTRNPCSPSETPPYLQEALDALHRSDKSKRRVFIETYGCQMNFNDTEIVLGVLEKSGGYARAGAVEDADVILLMTCAIRENAESKIWARLDALHGIEKRKKGRLTVGVLGCMAERLKIELMERKKNVDIVCGPDAYRDLPRLLQNALEGNAGINVMLSADETYADIAPVRLDPTKKSAFVSIMRGCNNMCAFCIVPFTRGRERSRPIESIVEETRRLVGEGVREITLLGQNVNSYCDESAVSSSSSASLPEPEPELESTKEPAMSRGFRTIYKPRPGGRRFVDLLDQVSRVDPNVRFRFTSPHPKDFPDDLLYLMRDRDNICKQIHLPAQSGSSAVLERMRRGYTREAYLDLVAQIRSIMPDVSLSSDFIAGFCGETDEDHRDTIRLIETVGYDMAYMFAYSMREKTMAHRRYADDVPEETKQKRLAQVIETFYGRLAEKVRQAVGRRELVLVEGSSKKSEHDLCGRTDGGRMLVFPRTKVADPEHKVDRIPWIGDYIEVEVVGCQGATSIARPLRFSSISAFHSNHRTEALNK